MVTDINKTPRKIAEEELRKERQEENVKRMKKKLRELDDARIIVKNLEREIEELEAEINEGL